MDCASHWALVWTMSLLTDLYPFNCSSDPFVFIVIVSTLLSVSNLPPTLDDVCVVEDEKKYPTIKDEHMGK